MCPLETFLQHDTTTPAACVNKGFLSRKLDQKVANRVLVQSRKIDQA